jgi:D-xylose transport system substrate-binding protein
MKKLMNNLWGLFLVAIFASACSKTDSTKAENKIKIGFVLSTMQEERYAKDKKYFEDKAQSMGAEVLFASANNSEQDQLAKVENLLSQRVNVLVIQPVNSGAASTFVKLAHRDGVKVVAYDRVIKNAPLDLYITQDSFTVGRLQAEAALKFTGHKGNYVILQGESGHSVANEITRGIEETLAQHSKVKVVVKQAHAGWSGELAMKTVENALTVQNNRIDAVLANNSGMANGAVQALTEQGLNSKVFVAGADADLTAIRNIVSGRQQFEVLKAIKPLAETAAEMAVRLARGETVHSDIQLELVSGVKTPVVNTPVFPVHKENIEEQIIKTGFHSREDVFGAPAR